MHAARGKGCAREHTGAGGQQRCYTVDLFTKVKVEKPAKDVPPEHRQFLGKWGGGAWNDVWCHDLLVTKVESGGRVELVEMHARYED